MYKKQRARHAAMQKLLSYKPLLRKTRFIKILKQIRLWGLAAKSVQTRRLFWRKFTSMKHFCDLYRRRCEQYNSLKGTPVYHSMLLVMNKVRYYVV
jgi:hypothetical protein